MQIVPAKQMMFNSSPYLSTLIKYPDMMQLNMKGVTRPKFLVIKRA